MGAVQTITLPNGPAFREPGGTSRLAVALNRCWWALHWGYRPGHHERYALRLLKVAAARGIEVSGLSAGTDRHTAQPGCEAAR